MLACQVLDKMEQSENFSSEKSTSRIRLSTETLMKQFNYVVMEVSFNPQQNQKLNSYLYRNILEKPLLKIIIKLSRIEAKRLRQGCQREELLEKKFFLI